jgi:hypothetical protein
MQSVWSVLMVRPVVVTGGHISVGATLDSCAAMAFVWRVIVAVTPTVTVARSVVEIHNRMSAEAAPLDLSCAMTSASWDIAARMTIA